MSTKHTIGQILCAARDYTEPIILRVVSAQVVSLVTGHLVDRVSYRILYSTCIAGYLYVSCSGSNTSDGGERVNFSAIVYL